MEDLCPASTLNSAIKGNNTGEDDTGKTKSAGRKEEEKTKTWGNIVEGRKRKQGSGWGFKDSGCGSE